MAGRANCPAIGTTQTTLGVGVALSGFRPDWSTGVALSGSTGLVTGVTLSGSTGFVTGAALSGSAVLQSPHRRRMRLQTPEGQIAVRAALEYL